MRPARLPPAWCLRAPSLPVPGARPIPGTAGRPTTQMHDRRPPILRDASTGVLPDRARPQSPTRRQTPPHRSGRHRSGWQDALFEKATLFFALPGAGVPGRRSSRRWSTVDCPRSRNFGPGFFVSSVWNPVNEQFGALVPIYGTLVTSVIALLIGVPVSFGIALFLTELSPPWLKRPLGTAIELLAAIPSIIYGMWGLFVFAPLFADYVQPCAASIRWVACALIGALFKGPPQRNRHADRRLHSVDHGHSRSSPR